MVGFSNLSSDSTSSVSSVQDFASLVSEAVPHSPNMSTFPYDPMEANTEPLSGAAGGLILTPEQTKQLYSLLNVTNENTDTKGKEPTQDDKARPSKWPE
ncbi:hypothetical protein GcM3_000035 [Golovinomyces cichoracearum]|uniref:Uncharacterized protein n=1 Tax=Golovinomyces cichoracearum TaxID=62708 RepID=A0A420JBG6_9PEZI|nr:hypothetical protein GcM3_000035 [Golovinomyces cichoracearum]